MEFERDGFAIVEDIVSSSQCEGLEKAIARRTITGAGSRNLLEEPLCQELAVQLRNDPRLSRFMPQSARAVQRTYFDKSAKTNWLVAFHQDLAVPLRARNDSPMWNGWSLKDGVIFANAPVSVLETMVAVRVHLDASTPENGPLRVVVGSHRLGRLSAADAARVRESNPVEMCLVPAGGALVLRPLMLHASSKSRSSRPRRVLHFLFGPERPDEGLAWHDAV